MRGRVLRLLLACAVLGGGTTLSLTTLTASTTATAVSSQVVSIGGLEVRTGEDAAALAERLETQSVQVDVLGEARQMDWAQLGASIDRQALAEVLGAVAFERPLALPAPVRIDPARATPWLMELKRDYDRPARSARIDVNTGEVVPEQDGRALDVWGTLARFRSALSVGVLGTTNGSSENTEGAALVTVRQGAQRSADAFEGLALSTSLGSFDTPYNGSGDAADRTHNLRVAAAKVDGVVLFPGDEFDFNAVVGERSLAEGFRPATVIAGGELVDGVGGGACQIAGSLHAAAFFAGLEITERHPHSRPSSYIKLGLDAAVSYPNLNFRFRNNRETPVLIRLRVQGGKTSAEIFGDEAHHRVQFVRRIDEFLPFAERTIEDDSMPTGVRVLTQRGVPGFELTRIRIVEDVNTRHMRRERSEDAYPPTTQTWRIGTGGASPEGYEVPTGDTHREYTADEFTIMTQGVGVEGTTTVRRAGRTGSYGWTERAGMPPAEVHD